MEAACHSLEVIHFPDDFTHYGRYITFRKHRYLLPRYCSAGATAVRGTAALRCLRPEATLPRCDCSAFIFVLPGNCVLYVCVLSVLSLVRNACTYCYILENFYLSYAGYSATCIDYLLPCYRFHVGGVPWVLPCLGVSGWAGNGVLPSVPVAPHHQTYIPLLYAQEFCMPSAPFPLPCIDTLIVLEAFLPGGCHIRPGWRPVSTTSAGRPWAFLQEDVCC
jgi:hypothetical protein